MNDPSPLQTTPNIPQSDKTTDTASRAIEATGGAPGTADRLTVERPPAHSGSRTAPLHQIGDYAVIKLIGEGGMGSVYLAEDTKLGRRVAIKTMKSALAVNKADHDRFIREARAAAAVEHDNIVPILHIGEAADGTPFIAMPFLQGEMLDARLKREPVCNLGILVKVAREVADGLAAAHAKGLIHRDIKPGNIWLEGDLNSKQLVEQIRRCKVLDFGLARSVDKEDAQITASGAILGTPAYMAPEQARGEKVDHRADLFSLGVMLYRMATGKPPFKGPNAMAVLISLTTETPAPVRTLAPNLPPALADLIDRMMCKDPTGRPQSAAEVSATVREIVKDVQARKAPPPVEKAPPAPAPVAAGSQPVPVYILPAPAPSPWEDATEAEGAPIAKAPVPPKRSRAPWYIAGGVLGLFALVTALAVVIVRVETAEGTLTVELNDTDVEARIKNGKLVLIGPDGKERYSISPTQENERTKKIDAGTYTIRVVGADGLALDTREFTLTKNGVVNVRVTLAPPKAVAKKDPTPSPAVLATDFREIHGASEAELERWMKGLRDDSFRPVFLSAEAGSAPRFSAIAVPNPTKMSWRFIPRDEIDTPQWKRNWQEQTDAGFRHTLCCLYHDDGRQFEWQVWTADVQPGGGWAGNREAIVEKLKECRTGKLRPVNLTAGMHKGALRFQFLMGPGGGRDWDAQLGIPLAELPDHVAKQQKKGWRLEWLSAYRDKDQLQFQTLFVEDPERAECDFRSGMTAKEYEARLAENAARGLRPVAVAGYVVDGRPLYAASWAVDDTAEGTAARDRKAAEYVLTIGGRIRINGEARDIRNLIDLPKEPFRLTLVDLFANKRATDAGLAILRGCRNLTTLFLQNTQVGDDGIAHLKECRGLTELWLWNTQVSDAGLVLLKNFKHLVTLNLGQTRITDAGLAHLSGCPKLAFLSLYSTAVGDAGLVHLRDIGSLEALWLKDTKVGDAGLKHLSNCKKLEYLNVQETLVFANGRAEVAKALPQCAIEWSGGLVEPALVLNPERNAARYALSIGGTVRINATDDTFRVVGDLPPGKLTLTEVSFSDNKRISDAGLANFKECKHLLDLNLVHTNISDEGLANFKNCTSLTGLHLATPPIGDAGVAHFKNCKDLVVLNFSGSKVTGKGLAVFKECKMMGGAWLNGAALGDADLVHLTAFPLLRAIGLTDTQVSDDGLAHLKGFKHLTLLRLHRTKVTANGAADLAKAIPQCRIEWDGGVIEPSAALNLERKVAEGVLATGGRVRVSVGGKVVDAGVPRDLPAGDLFVLDIDFSDRERVTDADLTPLADLQHLVGLHLAGTSVEDAGLRHLRGLTTLEELKLPPRTTDAGLEHLKGLTGLKKLHPWRTQVSGTGLHHLKDLPNLTYLDFSGSPQVTDESIRSVAQFQKLTFLAFGSTRIGDAGLVHLKGLTNLTFLGLGTSQVTDDGLVLLKGLTNLTRLDLRGSKITGRGLAHLKGFARLNTLQLDDSQVTDEGAVGLAGLTSLETLHVTRNLSDAGLVHLKGLTNLTGLLLSGNTRITGTGLVHLKGMSRLKNLHLDETQIDDAALRHLNDLPALRNLTLAGSKVTPDGLRAIQKALPECAVSPAPPKP